MSFWKGFFSSCLGALVALFLFTFGIIFFFAVSNSDTVVIHPKSVLQLRLALPISELEVEDELSSFFPDLADTRTGLLQLKEVLTNAASDSNIEGVFLNLSQIPAGFSSLREIREAILAFRESGKWVIAHADNYSEGAYYLASAASEIYLNPQGMLEFNGLSVEVMHYKKLFDKLEIKPEVFRVGDFKSAVEPYLLDKMSVENKLQLNSLIGSIYDQMLEDIATARSISTNQLREISDKMMVRNARQAVEAGLVDSLYYDDQVKNVMRKRLGLEGNNEISFVRYSDYRQSITASPASENHIAVIVADGEILPGNSAPGTVGSSTIIREIRKARKSKKVKAIVMRINSPGGSFQASDAMWREIKLAAETKPIIASLSDYAASGGYYLAMACDSIIAEPTTITGSIGIFSVLFDLSSFLENKIGITTDFVKTGEVGDMITFTRPLTPLEKEIWQKQTEESYQVFIEKASKGRAMEVSKIKTLASGRVWSGTQAKENGLVDLLGNFEKAVEVAASSAGISSYTVRYYPEPKSFLERLTQEAEQTIQTRSLKNELGELYPWYTQWQKVQHRQGVQARLPFEMTIQ